MDLDGRYDFDSFVVGSANRLAVAAAQAVAESPGSTYNPLYIWSAPGLGKTHLLTAIGHHALALQPTLQVDALTLDEFARQLHAVESMGGAPSFHQRFEDTGLLLIDDVQFLTGRWEAQAELLRLCDDLHGDGRQIACTGDRLPSDIADIDERLAAHLSGGLVVNIGLPDYETRTAILSAWCTARGVCFGPGAIEALGRVEVRSIRELQGALNRLIAHQAAGGRTTAVGVADVHRLFPECREPSRSANGRGPRASGASASASASEFLNFISEVAHVVARHVEPWRTDIGEAAARWAEEGYRVDVLDRALRAESDPGSAALIATFDRCVARLQALEREAAAIDPALAGMDVFRDPTCVDAAAALVARARSAADAATGLGDGVDGEAAYEAPYEAARDERESDAPEPDAPDPDAPEPDAPDRADPVPVAVIARRTSRGMVITSIMAEDPFFLDEEKVVWDWPDASGRVIEEFR